MALSERQRRTLERRLRAALAEGWAGSEEELVSILSSQASLSADAVPASFWVSLSAAMASGVTPLLAEAFMQSARKLAGDKLTPQITVSWDQVNVRAQRWAARYSFELVKGVTDTSRDRLRELVSGFAEQPELDLRGLGREIAGVFGQARGDMIAITEVTRASAQGELALAEEVRSENPRARVLTIWLTSQDELVCPVCGPRHGKARGNGWSEPPPAHPNCRCALGTDFVI